MTRRIFAALASVAVLSLMLASPVTAQEAPAVPPEPNVVDQSGDANGHSFATGQTGPVSVGAADFRAIWFTHDATNLYVHIHTTFPRFSRGSIWYSIYVDPGVGAECIEFRAFTQHDLVAARGRLLVTGDCGDVAEDVEFKTQEGPEDGGAATGIHTITVPRSLSEHFADGKTLAAPNALSRYYAGTDSTGGRGVWILDDTEPGRDYTISSGGNAGPDKGKSGDAPGKSDPPGKGKKKGCPKGKGKKKGACPKKEEPKVEACAPYQPGEQGAEAETVVVTDEATEEKPVEITVTHDPAVEGISPSGEEASTFHNIQVDTSAAEAGLYVRYEFPFYEDHDMYFYYPSGTEAARVAGFNPAPVALAFGCCDGTGRGGHSEQGAEVLDGLRTADCGGYDTKFLNYMGEGGEYTIKIWLGEIQNDPAKDGGGQA